MGSGADDPVTSVADEGSLNDRAARVFEFLVELQRLRTKVVRSLDAYRAVMWFSGLPDEEGIQSALHVGDNDAWLSVDRVEREAPPSPPEALRPWVTETALRDSSQRLPTLSPRAVRVVEVLNAEGEHETVTEELLLQEHPEVEDALHAWAPEWQAWAAEDRPRAAVGDIYHRLYEMYQDARALAETYEVVVGFGCLVTSSGGAEVRRHLVTVPVTIDLDLETGRLTVLRSPEAGAPSLEQDMLDPDDTVPDATREAIRQGLHELGDPWAAEPDGVAAALRTWVNGSGPDASYQHDPTPPVGRVSAEAPTVWFAPALILRERTRRSFIAACEQIITALRAGAEVPTGVRQFAQITDGRVPEAEQESWAGSYTDEETYFPKPANAEQRQIRERLADHQTVVVQGPPGTGKTHTIANLISDLLAHGQRVLITSTTTRALRVLKDKLPEEISDLCVSVTDDAVKGQADLERSVSTILTQADTWNQGSADREATILRDKLADARNRAQEALTELRSIREQESYQYAPEVGDYAGVLQDIAARLADEESALGWLGPVPADQPTLETRELTGLLSLLRQATPEVRALAGPVPDLAALPSPADVEDLVQRRTELLDRARDLADVADSPEYHALSDLGRADLDQLRGEVTDLSRRRQDLSRRREPWVPQALEDVAGGRERAWRQRHQDTVAGVHAAPAWLEWTQGHVVTGVADFELGAALGHANALLEHVANGGKLKGIFGRPRVVKEAGPFLERVRVDGRPCEDLAQLRVVHSHVTLETILQPLELAWGYPDQRQLPHPHRLARLEDEVSILGRVLEFGDAVGALTQRLRAVPTMPPLDPSAAQDLHRLDRTLAALALTRLQEEIDAKISPAARQLAQVSQQHDAVRSVARARTALHDWDVSGYRECFVELGRIQRANELLSQLEAITERVAVALPALTRALQDNPHDPAWDERLPRFAEAWAWSVWDARVRAKTDPAAERHWRDVLSVAEFDERAALEDLATNRGWSHALQRMTPTESTHLKMYAQAVRKAGKGTGKYAARHREDARTSLRACQSAVPAWIMPMHQVFDTVPVDRPNLFDVVIVDEASQSGLEGLLLSWLAPRMVVVGDDKQVSPSNVGLDHELVFTLQDRFLAPLEHKALFGPLSSFFDQAVGMSASRIMLREHFRCMPEIIGFSNQLCYRGELVPLRQYGADRLPPLRTTYVKGALVAGRRDVVNEAEVDALVAQVEKCCSDPAYDGKTMGVITLLGHAQDKLITQRLVEALGVRTVEERQLRAGNAEAFQGDERDVIFVSMVSSLQATTGPARIGPLSKESDQQRFNVAASRARDQVWLFHSVQPGDLSDKDLRRRYLQYLLKPPAEQDALDIGEVTAHQRHPHFDSLFEQRVFLAIRERGYRVRPQVKVGGYRIDLVIEGGTRRLAVECDGDAFHSGEAEIDDAARQRDLERVGWRFWRVRGSAFYRDPQTAMQPLWQLLEQLDIQPAWDMDEEEGAASAHTEIAVTASPVADPSTDLVEELLSAGPAPGPRETPDTALPVEVVPTRSETRTVEPVARFRAGKMLLSVSAHKRVQQEVEAIRGWLADPPPVHAVDARSREVQLAKQESLRDDLEGRLNYLSRVLAQSVADPDHQAGQWVTPGCIVGLRHPGEDEVERVVVTTMPDAHDLPDNLLHVSPFTELAQAIDSAEVGAEVRYQTPRGLQHATIAQVMD